jgi:hypothetical protein
VAQVGGGVRCLFPWVAGSHVRGADLTLGPGRSTAPVSSAERRCGCRLSKAHRGSRAGCLAATAAAGTWCAPTPREMPRLVPCGRPRSATQRHVQRLS